MTLCDAPTNIPGPEAVPKAKLRKFSAEYKWRILQEADNCTKAGQVGTLLRREGLYSSQLSTWRQPRERGLLEGLRPRRRERKRKDQLTLRADGGSPAQSKTVGQLLVDLGVTKSPSRPYTSSDNPRSEAQFKTMQNRPDYLNRFRSREQSRVWAGDSFHWYNHEHHHTGLGLMTPATVHHSLAGAASGVRRTSWVLRAPDANAATSATGDVDQPAALLFRRLPPPSQGPRRRQGLPEARRSEPLTLPSSLLQWGRQWNSRNGQRCSTLISRPSCPRMLDTFRIVRPNGAQEIVWSHGLVRSVSTPYPITPRTTAAPH